MATKTSQIQRHNNHMIENRRYDYAYDKNYHLSNQSDYIQESMKAQSSSSTIQMLPIYKTMFSELRHHPRFNFQYRTQHALPEHMANRDWPGTQNYLREKLIIQKTLNGDSSIQIPNQKLETTHVDGQDRFKFSCRPIIPFLNAVPPYVVLDAYRNANELEREKMRNQQQSQLDVYIKTVGTQTDYRDGEAQTDPYTPEYVVKPGTKPELLTLINLAYGRGLPVGLAEVEMIERARAKRAWELTLPPLNDASQLEKRLKMMNEMERKEWEFREHEIEELQKLRMELLKKMLKKREENQANILTKRLDQMWVKKQKEKEAKLRKLRVDNIKCIRKLIKKRENVENVYKHRNIIEDYANSGSDSHAPLTRHGYFPDKNADNYVIKNKYLNTYQGLLELEASLPPFVLELNVKAPKRITTTKDGYMKRKFREEKRLDDIHLEIKEKNIEAINGKIEKPLRFLKPIDKPIPRPQTPEVQIADEKDEEYDMGIIYLQKIIRGKAIQNMMYDGKQQNLVLIKELSSTHALQNVDEAKTKLYKQKVIGLQRQRHNIEEQNQLVDEVLQSLEGEAVSDMFDFLSKELIRLQEERRIHAFAMLAERQRRMREAEESGLRQVEERRRRQEDEIFKQLLKTQQDSVETYLEDCIMESCDIIASEEARKEIKNMSIKINDLAYSLEDTKTNLDSEAIVAELVHMFLIPEAQKQVHRQKLKEKQEPFLIAAHQEIYNEAEKTISNDKSIDQNDNK